MTVLLRRGQGDGAPVDAPAARRRSRLARPLTAVGVALAMVLSTVPLAAQADEHLTPGPTVFKDESSPTGYTGRFVYYNPEASSVRFVADILLRNWADRTDTTVYQPHEYKPGLMRGGGAYDVQMTEVEDGYWVAEVPLAAGVNQYWFYVNNNTNLWVADPANSPIYAPDGLTGTARRAFNKVYVPYDAEKQNFAPLAAREIENERPDTEKGTWGYVEIPGLPPLNGVTRTLGVYLPPGYDPNRAEPYKTIYMQHGGGQDQSDWLNIGDVPVIMDNLIADGLTEPAVVISPNQNYLGAANQGYPNLRNVVIPFVEENYNVSTKPIDRAFAGLSAGSITANGLINYDADAFGYWGPWSGGINVNVNTPDLLAPYIMFGGGAWDFGLPNANTVANLDRFSFTENVVVAGAHDFNAWNQLFTMFARDYLWKPAAFIQDEVGQLQANIEATGLNKGNKNALSVKLDQVMRHLEKGHNAQALHALEGYTNQVGIFLNNGKLTADEGAALTALADQIRTNLSHWLE